MRFRNCYCTVSLALIATVQVHAQTMPATSSGELPEIEITAQRRSERLVDVPLTVDTVSGEQLQANGVNNLQDLKLVVPGLDVANDLGFATPHIRGVGSTALGPGIESPIALYVDGVYIGSTASSLFDFINVSDVEVLKGPQGTLFGRNATGGLIQVTTREPTSAAALEADLTYGNYNTFKADLYASSGIANNLASDVAVQASTQGEGYGKNIFNNQDIDRNDLNFSVRNKWVWTPDDATKVSAGFDYTNQRNSNNVPQSPAPVPGVPKTSNPRDVDENVQPRDDNQNGGLSIKAQHQFAFASILDVVAYRQAATSINFDLDNSPVPVEDAILHSDEHQFSEELQLSSAQDAAIRWTTGLFYYRSYSRYDASHIDFAPFLEPILGFGSLSEFATQIASSVAGYGQATAEILPKTNLTLGVRYTYESHTLQGDQPLYDSAGAFIANSASANESVNFDKPTYRAAIDTHLTSNSLIYASVSTGFKSGGFNIASLTDPAYLPETLTAYEVGSKNSFLNNHVQANFSGFYYNYKNIQVQKVELANTGIINGASATVKGIDADLTASLTSHFTFTLSGEYLDARFDSFPFAPLSGPLSAVVPVQVGSAAGNVLPFAPHVTFTAGVNYIVNLPNGLVTFSATDNYSSRVYFEPDNVLHQDAYDKVNASAEWTSATGKYGIQVFGRNLTDKTTFGVGSTLVGGLRFGSIDPPRTYGIRFRYKM